MAKETEQAFPGLIVIPREYFEFDGVCYNIDAGRKLVQHAPRGHAVDFPTIHLARMIVHDPLFGADPDPNNIYKPEYGKIEINKHDAFALKDEYLDIPGLAVFDPKKNDGLTVIVIDGWKRAYRRWRNGLEWTSVFLLADDARDKIIMAEDPMTRILERLNDTRSDAGTEAVDEARQDDPQRPG